ncbi:MAG: hypothetical protein IIC53_03045 [Proteobacteria bacterium]|nr:hypothetical protein [Pseudomonadota bacterium]
MTDSREDTLARAKGYPYDLPKASYLLFEGKVVTERGYEVNDMAKRTPVLAYGSNAAPEQLKRKFAKTLAKELIPVFKVILPGFDVVYSARLSRYGAIPAMLAPSKGTVLESFVTYLTKRQLRIMHKTELSKTPSKNAYQFGELRGLTAMIDRVGVAERLYVYHSLDGALSRDGAMVAYEEVTAQNRTLLAVPHAEMLAMVHRDLDGAGGLDDFILNVTGDDEARRAHSATLRETAIRIRLPRYKKVPV